MNKMFGKKLKKSIEENKKVNEFLIQKISSIKRNKNELKNDFEKKDNILKIVPSTR